MDPACIGRGLIFSTLYWDNGDLIVPTLLVGEIVSRPRWEIDCAGVKELIHLPDKESGITALLTVVTMEE
ncbi:hypothetical protein DVH24_015025 [Malus domestica]|uniref:Uncharacterized protein n=1 Tax=Malus domestica TaxID=3750 RepID=A0A498K2J6_MALDO|nr:hypothetical protein DVH24_015025 [Malus domestica]